MRSGEGFVPIVPYSIIYPRQQLQACVFER